MGAGTGARRREVMARCAGPPASHLVFGVVGGIAHRAARGRDILAHALNGIAAAQRHRHQQERGETRHPAETETVGWHTTKRFGHLLFLFAVPKDLADNGRGARRFRGPGHDAVAPSPIESACAGSEVG
jgi:hypothetical protein